MPLGPRIRERSPGGQQVPDIEAMRRWLLSAAIAGDAGAVLSWWNPRHPGYPYPEAAGLLLSTLSTAECMKGVSDPTARRVAAWLCASVGADGGVGRGGTTYLFDSAVVLAGLLRYRRGFGDRTFDATIHRLKEFLCERIAAGVAVLPHSAAADGRWSTQFGAHLLKCLHSLHLYATTFAEPLPAQIVAAVIERSGQQASPIYLHPFCYEHEGRIVAAHYGVSSLFEPIEGVLDWLVALQQDNGALLAFANGMEGYGEPRSDSTAQAVRLWLLADQSRYSEAIARGLAFLAACQTEQGGILYTPERDDVCSWSTMFALQAFEWCIHRPSVDDLL